MPVCHVQCVFVKVKHTGIPQGSICIHSFSQHISIEHKLCVRICALMQLPVGQGGQTVNK